MALTVTGLSAVQRSKLRVAIDQVREGKYPDSDSNQAVIDAEVEEHLDNLHVTSDSQQNEEGDRTARAAASRADLGLR